MQCRLYQHLPMPFTPNCCCCCLEPTHKIDRFGKHGKDYVTVHCVLPHRRVNTDCSSASRDSAYPLAPGRHPCLEQPYPLWLLHHPCHPAAGLWLPCLFEEWHSSFSMPAWLERTPAYVSSLCPELGNGMPSRFEQLVRQSTRQMTPITALVLL